MRTIREWTYLCVVLTLAACSGPHAEEISPRKPYADLIGARYRVVVDHLQAYGVYESLNNRIVSYVTLIPLVPGVGGPEFAFHRYVPKGQVIKILSAWREFLWGYEYYLVEVENSDLPQGVPVKVDLSRGNEGVGVDLNPAVYRKLP